MTENKNIVAIILARGGSKRMPRKNIQLLAGKPLIAYTIESAKKCGLIDRVIVSTDDDEIAEVSKKYRAETPFKRSPELATDTALVEPCLKHAIEWLEQNENYKTDIVVYLQTTDIFRPKGIIEKAVKKLLENDNLDSVFSAVKTHKNFWRNKPASPAGGHGNYERMASDIPYGQASQVREPLYREDTGIVLATRAKVIKNLRRIGDRADIVLNEEEINFIDLHDQFDFWLAEKCIGRLKEENKINLYEL